MKRKEALTFVREHHGTQGDSHSRRCSVSFSRVLAATATALLLCYAGHTVPAAAQTVQRSDGLRVAGEPARIEVSIWPPEAVVKSGSSTRFAAIVKGTPNQGITWTAALGSIDSNGTYRAPSVAVETPDTVTAVSTADGSTYASIDVIISPDVKQLTPGHFSITSQPPVSWVPYAANSRSITMKQLPNAGKGGPTNHLYPNSDAIARCALTDCGNTAAPYGLVQFAKPGVNDRGTPVYYSDSSMPWYKLSGCTIAKLNGKVFHAPSGAQFSQSSDDQAITIIDSSTHLIVASYHFGPTLRALPPSSCSGTGSSSCAVGANFPGYCAVENYNTDPDWGLEFTTTANGTGGSIETGSGFSAFAAEVRQAEVQQGVINHAIRVIDDCHNPANKVVFPGSVYDPGLLCSSANSSRPPGGALLFLDYTDAQITAMHLPTWQKAYITALSHYGGYIGVTSGQGGMVFGENNSEDGLAWTFAGLTDPFWSWIGSQPGISTYKDRYTGYIFANIPLVNGTDVTHHFHMADPCVVKTMAGVSGGC